MNNLNINITNTLNGIINMIFSILRFTFNKLESIEFWNTNLLQWSITITILLVVIPIIFTIVKSGTKTIGNTSREMYKRSKQ